MKMNSSPQIGESFVKRFVIVPFRVYSAHFQISLQQEHLLDYLVILMATQNRVRDFENFRGMTYLNTGGLYSCGHDALRDLICEILLPKSFQSRSGSFNEIPVFTD